MSAVVEMRKEAKQNNESAKPAIFRPYSELYAEGKRLRDKCPRTSHAEWKLPKNRPDPLFLLEESSKGRMIAPMCGLLRSCSGWASREIL